jgi:hypothetical protein
VKKLIEKGADLNLCPNEDKKPKPTREPVPPLYYATAQRDAGIVKILLDAGRARQRISYSASNSLMRNDD